VRLSTVADDAAMLLADAFAARRLPVQPDPAMLARVAAIVSNALKSNRHRDQAVAIRKTTGRPGRKQEVGHGPRRAASRV
jgi:hypothetical protein